MSNVIGFINGVEANARNPKTFHIPDEHVKANIKPGYYVKLGFKLTPKVGQPVTERMWVKVEQWDGKQGRGILDNDPVAATIKCGDVVRFDADAILDILA